MIAKEIFDFGDNFSLSRSCPAAVAQIAQQTQSIHVSGTAKYPRNISPSRRFRPHATNQTVRASHKIFPVFPNGTSCPTSLSNLPCNIYGPLNSINPNAGKDRAGCAKSRKCPHQRNRHASNVNVPSNIQFNMAGDVEFNPIAPGQTANLYIAITMVTTNTNFVSGTLFSYSFDVTITATQA